MLREPIWQTFRSYGLSGWIETSTIATVSNSSDPVLTVVVVCWNQGQFLHQCLESIRDSNTENFTLEVLIFDNDSADNSLTVAKEFVRSSGLGWKVIRSPVNRGANPSLNRALQIATGELFVWVSGDDFLDPERLRTQVGAFQEQSPDVVMVSGTAIEVDNGGGILPGRSPISLFDQSETVSLRTVKLSDSFCGPHVVTQMLRTSALRRIGGWPVDQPFADTPVDFLLSMIENSKLHHCPSAITYYRIHPDMSSVYLNSHMFVQLYDFMLAHPDLSEDERGVVERRRSRAAARASYEKRLVDFGSGKRFSRWSLLKSIFTRRLSTRSRLNCLLLGTLPVFGRRRCRTRYRTISTEGWDEPVAWI